MFARNTSSEIDISFRSPESNTGKQKTVGRRRVVEMRECQWKQLAKRGDIATFLKTLKTVQPKRQLSFHKILEGVKNGTLYGFLLVDTKSFKVKYLPNHLK